MVRLEDVGGGLGEEMVGLEDVGGGLGEEIEGLEDVGGGLGEEMEGFGEEILGLEDVGGGLGEEMEGFGEEIVGLEDVGGGLGEEMEGFGEEMVGLEDVGGGLGEEMEGFGEEMVGLEDVGWGLGEMDNLEGLGEAEDEGLGEAMVNLFTVGHIGGNRRGPRIDWIDLPILALSMTSLFSIGDVGALGTYVSGRCAVCLRQGRSNQYIAIRDCGHWLHGKCDQEYRENNNVHCPNCKAATFHTDFIFLNNMPKTEEDYSSVSESDSEIDVVREQTPPSRAYIDRSEYIDRYCTACGSVYIVGRIFHTCMDCGLTRCGICYTTSIGCECGSVIHQSIRYGVDHMDALNNSGSEGGSLHVLYDSNDLEERSDLEGWDPDYGEAEWDNPHYSEDEVFG